MLDFLLTSMWSARPAMHSSNTLLCLLFLSALIFSTRSETTEISFPQFSANDSTLRAFGDMEYDAGNHSWIMNAKSVVTLTGTCALLMYDGDTNLRIQDSAAGTVASFSTSFTFKFTTPPQRQVWDTNITDSRAATALSFSIGANVPLREEQPETYMQYVSDYIGQPGPCTYTDIDNYFSITFDTAYNYNKGEPSNNFIGILEGVSDQVYKPRSTYNLCGNQTHCSYLSNAQSFTAWIDFTLERTLQVWLRNGSYPHAKKPLTPLLEYPNFQLPPNLGDYMVIQLVASSSESHIQAHEISSWTFYSTSTPKISPSSKNKWIGPVFGVIGTLATLLIIVFFSLWLARRRHFKSISYTSALHIFSYKELCKATKNFNETEKLGSGGFGTVYRGSIEKFGIDTLVAVKRINYESTHAETTFLAEISSLTQIKHGNVVLLQGWCHEKDRLLLVYNYMPNGSLSEWLHGSSGTNGERKVVLSWKVRHDILEGVAAAVEYLHKDCPQCVLHRDIKSSNVMLDADFKAHLGDFGLARLMDHQKLDKTTMAAGTIGYMAPEVAYTGKATKESDVYSFGILVLEVVCGRRPLDLKGPQGLDLDASNREDHVLLYNVWRAHESGTLLNVIDPRVHQLCTRPSISDEPQHGGLVVCANETQPCPSVSSIDGNVNSSIVYIETLVVDAIESLQDMMLKNLLHLGLLCCLPNPKARPTMGQVIQILDQIGDIENVDYGRVKVSMPPLPDTNPMDLYSSMEFLQLAKSVLT